MSSYYLFCCFLYPKENLLSKHEIRQGSKLLPDCLSHVSLKQESTFHFGHMLELGNPSAMLGGTHVLYVLRRLRNFSCTNVT